MKLRSKRMRVVDGDGRGRGGENKRRNERILGPRLLQQIDARSVGERNLENEPCPVGTGCQGLDRLSLFPKRLRSPSCAAQTAQQRTCLHIGLDDEQCPYI